MTYLHILELKMGIIHVQALRLMLGDSAAIYNHVEGAYADM